MSGASGVIHSAIINSDRIRGSSQSRNASPSTLNANTVNATASAGKTAK